MKYFSRVKVLFFILPAVNIFLSLNCFAQYNWINYDSTSFGVPSNNILCVTTDRNGNVWAGLSGLPDAYGLLKFDGLSWVLYNTGNSGLPSNGISSLCVDTNNNLWIGTYTDGLVKFDGTNWAVYNTSGSGIIDNHISSLDLDPLNRIWIGSGLNGISIFDGITFINHTSSNWAIPNDCINTIAFDASNKVWMGFGCGGGIAVLKLTDSTWTYYNTGNSGLPSNYVSSIVQDHSGIIWAGISLGYWGIAKFDGSNWLAISYGIPYAWTGYNSMIVDDDNKLWIGTEGKGLVKYDGNWTYFSPPPDTGGSSNQSVCIDIHNHIWYAEQVYTGLWTADLMIGIDENNFSSDGIKVYPNPVSNNLTIEISSLLQKKKELSIYNTLGQEVLKKSFWERKCVVDVSTLRSGIYFLCIKNKDKIFSQKFIISR